MLDDATPRMSWSAFNHVLADTQQHLGSLKAVIEARERAQSAYQALHMTHGDFKVDAALVSDRLMGTLAREQLLRKTCRDGVRVLTQETLLAFHINGGARTLTQALGAPEARDNRAALSSWMERTLMSLPAGEMITRDDLFQALTTQVTCVLRHHQIGAVDSAFLD